MVREGIELVAEQTGLRIVVNDFHAGPVHLTVEDLAELGIAIRSAATESSYAQRWLSRQEVEPDKEPYGPALTDPEWTEPKGHQVGDLFLAPVRDGLDIYVNCYHAPSVTLSQSLLGRLGLEVLPQEALAEGPLCSATGAPGDFR